MTTWNKMTTEGGRATIPNDRPPVTLGNGNAMGSMLAQAAGMSFNNPLSELTQIQNIPGRPGNGYSRS